MVEELHKIIEKYIVSNMTASGIKYSLTIKNARDFSLPDAPLLSEGSDNYIIFTVIVNTSTPSAVGNAARRQSGIVRVDCHLDDNLSTDRDYYRMLDHVTNFLEGRSTEGVHFRDFNSAGDSYSEGKWQVSPTVISFESNRMRD